MPKYPILFYNDMTRRTSPVVSYSPQRSCGGHSRRIKKSGRKILRNDDSHRLVNGVWKKFCRKCKRWKDETAFYKNRSGKDGLDDRCKTCSYKGTSKPRHRIVKGIRKKLCCKCRKWKRESDFYKSRSSKDGLRGRCRKCLCKAAGKSPKQ